MAASMGVQNDIKSRRLDISDMEVKETAAAKLRRVEKFQKDDSMDMKNQKRHNKNLITHKKFETTQSKHTQFLLRDHKLSAREVEARKIAELVNEVQESKVLNSFRDLDGDMVT